KKLLPTPIMISLSPAFKGKLKVAFSRSHLPSGSFAIGAPYQFLSIYTGLLLISTHTSSLKPRLSFLICSLSDLIVVFNHTILRSLLGPNCLVRLTSPLLSAVNFCQLVFAVGRSEPATSLPDGKEMGSVTDQLRR